tara:strand:- start:2589 stop:2768 length:180 start_codon:yes stop_codon:yes gene_type:complete
VRLNKYSALIMPIIIYLYISTVYNIFKQFNVKFRVYTVAICGRILPNAAIIAKKTTTTH